MVVITAFRILVHQDLEGKPIHSLSTAFEETNRLLSASGIDVLLSGTTATVAMLMVYVMSMYPIVLTKLCSETGCMSQMQETLVAFLADQGNTDALRQLTYRVTTNQKIRKRAKEYWNMEWVFTIVTATPNESKGRVCKPLWIPHDEEEEIGPARVWLMEENLPGLAMSRLITLAVGQQRENSYFQQIARGRSCSFCRGHFHARGHWTYTWQFR